MKTNQRLYFKRKTALLMVFFISLLNVYGANFQKTYAWKYPATRETKINMDNFDCDLVIHVTDKNETEFHLTLVATGLTKDDETRLMNFLDNYKFSSSESAVNFHNTFWKNRQTVNGRTTLKIEAGKNIELTEFLLTCELWIPVINPFNLVSKYSKIDLEDFNGRLWLDLNNSDLYAGNVAHNIDLTAKYSNIEFRNIKDLKADLYNCYFEAGNSGKISVISKYSKFIAVSSGNLDADSFNDKFSFEKTGDIIFKSKYSDLSANTSGTAILNCYNGTIAFGTTKDIRIESMYANFQFNHIDNCIVTSSYNDIFRIGEINTLNILQSRYSNYKADKIYGTLTESNGDNDKFTITSFGEKFRKVNIDGKYLDISLGILTSADFRLRASIQYPSFHVNETSFKTKTKIHESSNLQYEGIKGIEKEGMPEIEVKGNNVTLRIAEVK